MQTTAPAKPSIQLSDERAAGISIAFVALVCVAIMLLGTWLLRFELATPPADDVGFFYEWKLADPTFLSRATIWLGFGLHQLLVWLTIWWAMEKSPRKYTKTLKPVNYVALGINAVFIVLHYLQTAFFYDAIAQDIPSWTAQGAVIMMLFVILAFENRRRGLFFGKKIKFKDRFYQWIKEYHGYAFSFAVIYTFWFHPMVPTLGHLVGFIQVFLVLIQGSLMFTRLHLNRRWIVVLELLVLPHAFFVALNQSTTLIYMFVYGFAVMFLVSQMHALNLKVWVRRALYFGFVLTLFVVYFIQREPFMLNEVIRIPVILYGMVFFMYGAWWLIMQAISRIQSLRVGPPQLPAAGD